MHRLVRNSSTRFSILLAISLLSIYSSIKYKISYVSIAPAISFFACYLLFYSLSKIEKSQDETGKSGDYLFRLFLINFASYLVWDFVVGDSIYSYASSYISNSKREMLLIFISINSSIFASIQYKGLNSEIYPILKYADQPLKKYEAKHIILFFVLLTVLFYLVPYAARKALDGGDFTIYWGDWTLSIILTSSYFIGFFVVLFLLRLKHWNK